MTTETEQDTLLLVKAQSAQRDLDSVIKELTHCSGLDGYTLRQRLIGPAISQLHKGAEKDLRPLADLLRHHQIDAWLVQPRPLSFAPATISGLTIRADKIVFECRHQRFKLKRGMQPLIVVADLSGQISANHLKRLLVHNAHTGTSPEDPSQQALQKEIFKQAPVIDLYWSDCADDPQQAVRIIPGKFDHRQLGDKAELSRNRNLAALLEVICDYCPQHHIDHSYGLGFLPDYRVKPLKDLFYHHKENLDTLTRYGWLLLEIAGNDHGQQKHSGSTPIQQLLETSGLAAVLPVFDNTADPQKPPAQPRRPKPPSLPPPPGPQTRSGLRLHFSSWRLAATFGGIVIIILSEGQQNLPAGLYRYGVSSGLLPLLVSGLCLWNALYYWRLKRRMENTPTSKARSAAMGMVEIHGQARRLYALVSPTTQTPCIYYCLKKYRRSGKDSTWRMTSVTSSDNVPFILEDETGRITIDPQGATLRSKITYDNATGNSSAHEKWKEEVIYEGTTLYVMGFARMTHNDQDTLRQRVADKLRNLKTDRQQLMQYDHNSDGTIDAAEWDSARADMEQQALHDKLHGKLHQGQQRSNQQLVIGAPPQKGLPFIIAETESETHLIRHYSWYIPPLLVTGIAIFSWALTRAATFFHLI
ncbi:MAG: hypothetical protein J7K75_01635 [Desulfuromonas sp.]|nr:hypothetical protein [Desulfuromonas sp.]